jgi:predicted permease
VTQIAASFLLLAGAGALLRTLLALERTQPAFDTAHVLVVNLPVMAEGRTPEQIYQFYREAQRRVTAVPGVERVATGLSAPWRDARWLGVNFAFSFEGLRREDSKDDLRARFRTVSLGYFATLGIPIVAGRDFNEGDRRGAERVVIISSSVAQQLFHGRDTLNRHLMWTDPVMKFIDISTEPRRIVGIVADLDDESIIPAPNMTVYHPFEQEATWTGRLFVRAQNDPYMLVPSITRTIRVLAADQPVERPSTLDDVRAEVLAPNRLNAIVFGGFGALALAISVVGVAGVLAFSVSWRTREFGIRLALGALPQKILASVLREGIVIAVIGVAVGFLAGFGLSRLLGSYIQELQAPSAQPLILSAVVILGAAVIASALPALRAARVDPVRALRTE